MAYEIKIWEIDEPSKAAKPLQPAGRVETEIFLGDLLAENPDMLMPDLLPAGRQTPTDGGIIDLLGVDKDGQLVVFELKRGKLHGRVNRRNGVEEAARKPARLQEHGPPDRIQGEKAPRRAPRAASARPSGGG